MLLSGFYLIVLLRYRPQALPKWAERTMHRRITIALSLAGCLACLAISAPAPALSGKRALILHSYYKGYRWTDDENHGMESVLLPELGAANVYIDYMDRTPSGSGSPYTSANFPRSTAANISTITST
jgi:hypothetical protein